VRSAVVAVGDELLLGDVVNGNAAWLGTELAAVGAPVVHSSMVGDDVDRIVAAVRRALEDADVVLLTGGLGPTVDDLTRDAVAAVAGVPLDRSPEIEQQLRDRFAAYGYDMPEPVLRQADVPRGATALDNPVGTAPGLRVELPDRLLFALPGPPHELAAVMTAHVLAELAERSGQVVLTRTLQVAGLGESSVAERVEAAVTVPDGVALSYLAGGAVVRVRFTTAAPDRAAADAVLQPLVDAAAGPLGEHVLGYDDDALPAVVVRLLREAGSTVAVAESLTAGLVGAALTDVPGSSAVFRGGVQVYATDLKATLAGVPQAVLDEHGAVSPQTAEALAQGVRDRLGASYGLALTGVAGPDEQEGHPPGTLHVAVADERGTAVRSVRLPGDRQRVRLLAVTTGLDLLRRRLGERASGRTALSEVRE
jgi:nicotinamide-nucleotide amidase